MSEVMLTLVTDSSDIEAAFNIISEELYVTGYPELPNYNTFENGESLLLYLINAVWTLVKHRRKYISEKLDKEQNTLMLEENVKSLQRKLSDVENNYRTAKSEINKTLKDCEMLKAHKTHAVQELKSVKSAFQKTNKLLESKNNEYQNKIRQKECEIIELQKTLEQKIDFKKSSNNTINRLSKDSVSTEGADQKYFREMENMYKASFYRLENTITTLVQENVNLRNSLELLTTRLLKLLQFIQINVDHVLKNECENEVVQEYNKKLSTHLFNVPGENIVKLVEEHVSVIIVKIKNLFTVIWKDDIKQ